MRIRKVLKTQFYTIGGARVLIRKAAEKAEKPKICGFFVSISKAEVLDRSCASAFLFDRYKKTVLLAGSTVLRGKLHHYAFIV